MAGKGKITFEQAEHIRALYALTPMSQQEIGDMYECSKENIKCICQYKIHIPEHMKPAKGPAMCKAGLHDMDAPNGRNTDGVCRECVNARCRKQRRDNPEKYGR